jgi:signal transduction histidine kinase
MRRHTLAAPRSIFFGRLVLISCVWLSSCSLRLEAQVPFGMEPAFWQEWWFRLAPVLALVLNAWLLYRIRMHQRIAQLNIRFEERLGERTRIAQDLHDTLLQGVLSAAMHVHVTTNGLPDDSTAKPLLIQTQQVMDQAINEGRTALQGLRSSSSAQRLEQAFSRIPQELSDQQDIAYRVVVEGSPRPLHSVIRDEVYRVGYEAVVNAFRHAMADSIEVQVQYCAAHLRVAVCDDGRGIDPRVVQGEREGHWGLPGMREHAEQIGARLKLRSRLNTGTEVELIVPHDVAYEQQSGNGRASWMRRLSSLGHSR